MNRLQSLTEATDEPFAFAGPAHRILPGWWEDPCRIALEYEHGRGEAPVAVFKAGGAVFLLEENRIPNGRPFYSLFATRAPFGGSPLTYVDESNDPRLLRWLLTLAPILLPGITRPEVKLPDEPEAEP